MKERPIIFSDEMVRAILEGQKTQTRRVIKPQPLNLIDAVRFKTCPYGVPGDRLWVRECFGFTAKWTMSYQRQWLAERGPWLPGNITMAYRSDEPEGNWCWKPSIHMPKIYSRITLEIVNVRVDRLQDISEEDACAEGIEIIERSYGMAYRDYRGKSGAWMSEARASFGTLWDRINAKQGYGWDTNPWVWVIEFRRIDK